MLVPLLGIRPIGILQRQLLQSSEFILIIINTFLHMATLYIFKLLHLRGCVPNIRSIANDYLNIVLLVRLLRITKFQLKRVQIRHHFELLDFRFKMASMFKDSVKKAISYTDTSHIYVTDNHRGTQRELTPVACLTHGLTLEHVVGNNRTDT